MARYIDADALEKKLQSTTFATGIVTPFNRKWFVVISRIIDRIFSIIKEFPTADVEEVKHSWLEKPTELSESICHKCRKPPKMLFGVLPDYCPHCGAIFDGKESGDGRTDTN